MRRGIHAQIYPFAFRSCQGQTPKGEGVYLTVHTSPHPNTDTVECYGGQMIHIHLPCHPPTAALHCTALHSTQLHCTPLHYTEINSTLAHSTALHSTLLNYTVLYFIAMYCTALHFTQLHCTILYFNVLHCTLLQNSFI